MSTYPLAVSHLKPQAGANTSGNSLMVKSDGSAVRLSVYTFVRNGLFYDFHVVQMLRHHLPLADEIVVNEGYSTDGTYEAIKDLDPKIHVHRNHWDRSDPFTWHIKFKNEARRRCTGDWCILLDCDEFIPEWDFDRLRSTLASTDRDILTMGYKHFYGSYLVYKARNDSIKHTPVCNNRIHRNLDDIEVWGDGANVWRRGDERGPRPSTPDFECHHFGEVRHAARLRQKWRTQSRQHNQKNPRWDWVPKFAFDLLPHRWLDRDILPDLDIYDGPHIAAVREDREEFVRDNFVIYRHLVKNSRPNNGR